MFEASFEAFIKRLFSNEATQTLSCKASLKKKLNFENRFVVTPTSLSLEGPCKAQSRDRVADRSRRWTPQFPTPAAKESAVEAAVGLCGKTSEAPELFEENQNTATGTRDGSGSQKVTHDMSDP